MVWMDLFFIYIFRRKKSLHPIFFLKATKLNSCVQHSRLIYHLSHLLSWRRTYYYLNSSYIWYTGFNYSLSKITSYFFLHQKANCLSETWTKLYMKCNWCCFYNFFIIILFILYFCFVFFFFFFFLGGGLFFT